MLNVSQADLEIIRTAKNELLLGIITKDEEVRLTVADSVRIPGHREWLRRIAIPDRDVVGAFSMHVKNGQIRWLYPNSALNPADDGLLRDDCGYRSWRCFPWRRTWRNSVADAGG